MKKIISHDLLSFCFEQLLLPVSSADEFYKTFRQSALSPSRWTGSNVNSSHGCSHPPSADRLFLPQLLERAPLLPQTTPEPQVTGECGWLLGRAVSMETKVPVGEQKAARGQVLVPPLQAVCLGPLRPSLPCPIQGLSWPVLDSAPALISHIQSVSKPCWLRLQKIFEI